MKNHSSFLLKSLAGVFILMAFSFSVVMAQPDTVTARKKVVKLKFNTSVNGKETSVDTTIQFNHNTSDEDINKLVESIVKRVKSDGDTSEFYFKSMPSKGKKKHMAFVYRNNGGHELEELSESLADLSGQDSMLRVEIEKLGGMMPDPAEMEELSRHFNITDFNCAVAPPCRIDRHMRLSRPCCPSAKCEKGNRMRHGRKNRHIAQPPCNFYMYGNKGFEAPVGENETIIINGEGDTIIMNGNKMVIMDGMGKGFPGMDMENMDVRVLRDSINDSLQVTIRMSDEPGMPEMPDLRFENPEEIHRMYFAGGEFRVADLNTEDIDYLKRSDLKSGKKYKLLGVDAMQVERTGPEGIALEFRLPEGSEVEVMLFDASGENIYHEVLKKFSGDYYKEIETGMVDILYLKISQGGKTLMKKILSD